MSLDTYDFFNLVERLFKKKIDEVEDKQEERLFHTWGYQIPVMKDPISYAEFKKKAEGKAKRRPQNTRNIRKKSNQALIERIEEIKRKDQKKAGD